MPKISTILSILLMPFLLYASPNAEFTHFLNHHFLDSRSGGLGGSYVGLSDTLVGTYYNPSGLAFMDVKRKTESSNLYKQSTLEYASDTIDLAYEFSTNTAPFTGFFQAFGDYQVAFSIIVPKAETFNKDDTQIIAYNDSLDLRIIENLDGYNTHYLIGPSISTLLQDNLSIGMSLFYSSEIRNYNQNVYSKIENSDDLIVWSNAYNEESITELLGIFGVQWMPLKSVALGSTLKVPILLSNSGDEQAIESIYNNLGETAEYTTSVTNSAYDLHRLGFQSNYTILSAGTAIFFSPSTLLAIDFDYMFGSSSSIFPTADTFNYSFGVEHYLFPFIPIRLGYYSNYSYYPDDEIGDHIDSFGITLSAGFDNGQNALNFLIDYQHGTGFNDDSGNYSIDYDSVSFLVSGSTNL